MGIIRKAIDLFKPHMRPSLIVIGAQKAGTSTVYEMLRRHPQVLAPKIKELDFFAKEELYSKGLGHYWSCFPKRPWRGRDMITFEASPSYLYYAEVAAPRIREALPSVHCLALLRDPAKRAYSSWNMYRDFKDHPRFHALYDPRSFAQAIEDELAGKDQPPYRLYLKRGMYSEQLRIFKKHFPEDRLLIHSFLELKRDPHALMGKLCARLGIRNFDRNATVLGVKANSRSYPEPIDPEMDNWLYSYYEPELQRLEELLGRRLDLVERKVNVG